MNTRLLSKVLIGAVVLAFAAVLFFMYNSFTVAEAPAISSVEFGITAVSPKGEEGGLIIPASCPSYAHFPGQCDVTAPDLSGGGTINPGDSATISWTCYDSTSSAGVNFSTGGATSGSVPVTPAETTTYTVICSNSGEGSVTVTVADPNLTISGTPTQVRSGNSTTIEWSAVDVIENSCSVTGPDFSASGESGSEATGPIIERSTYTLTCETEGGFVSESTTINLIPSFEEF